MKGGKKKNIILVKAVFGINGMLFLMGSLLLMGDNKLVLALLQFLAFLLNIGMLFHLRDAKIYQKLNYAILGMNVVVCLSLAIDSILSNKMYIQYAWFLAAIISFIALFLQNKTRKNAKI